MNMIKQGTIDLNEADGYAVTEYDVVIKRLKKDRIYRSNLMYRGFNGEMLEKVLRTGADIIHKIECDDEIIHCNDEEGLKESIQSVENPLSYAIEHPVPALAVYDSSKLIEQGDKMVSFVNPKNKLEALVAVYLLKT